MKSFLGQTSLPRGLRNNNPGNLVKTNIPWAGKITPSGDPNFEQFNYLEYGIRAMASDTIHDVNAGMNTITSLITEYAPPSENNTAAYIASVSDTTGIAPTVPFLLNETTLAAIIKAKIEVENGSVAFNYITDEDIQNGINLLPESLLISLKKKRLPTA